jgi:hypothetical protein
MSTVKMPGFTAEASVYRTGEHYRTAGSRIDRAGSRGVVPQLQNQDDWTTDTICKACGCTVKGFICDCGLRPRPDKLECIRNGGPVKTVTVRGILQGRRA